MLWVGRYAIVGTRKIPLLGTIEFRTDNYVLAQVTATQSGGYALEQQVCRVSFERAAGAKVSMDEDAPRAMPTAYPVFEPDAEADAQAGAFAAAEWPSGWDDVDLDNDTHPGMAVRVQAPICGGTLHVASTAKSVATGTASDGGGISGDIDIFVDQRIKEVEGRCLRWMSKDSADWMHGKFIYQPVSADSTCDTVEDWPDPMPEDDDE